MNKKKSKKRKDLRSLEERLTKAFHNQNYKYRTLNGLVIETKANKEQILNYINTHPDEFVSLYRTDKHGNKLFTLRKIYRERATFSEKFMGALLNRVY